MHLLMCNMAALVIAVIYYAWRDGYEESRKLRLERVQRERVTYMLWIAAQR